MLNTIKNLPFLILLSLSSAFAVLCFIITIIISQILLSEVEAKQSLDNFVSNYKLYVQASEQLRAQRQNIIKLYDATSRITTNITAADALIAKNRSIEDVDRWTMNLSDISDTAGLMLYHVAVGVKGQNH